MLQRPLVQTDNALTHRLSELTLSFSNALLNFFTVIKNGTETPSEITFFFFFSFVELSLVPSRTFPQTNNLFQHLIGISGWPCGWVHLVTSKI